MTEDEAKTKWCPHVRVAYVPEAVNGCNRPFEHSYQACIGSACMAWRTTPAKSLALAREYADVGQKINAIKALREVFGDLNLLEAKNIVEGAALWPTEPIPGGFCGLAGAPA